MEKARVYYTDFRAKLGEGLPTKLKRLMKKAGIRAVKTVAQTAVATIGTATALGQVDAKLVVSASVLAGILSLLTSIAGLPECNAEGE